MALGPFYQRKSSIAAGRRRKENANADARELVERIRREAWAEWRPIVNAIGEISVQEAMDAIDKLAQ